MPQLNELADWLGYELVHAQDTDQFVVRYRQQTGKWCVRDQPVTDAEVRLYDAVRGLVATQADPRSHGLVLLGMALGVPYEEISQRALLERIAAMHEELRQWREAEALDRARWAERVQQIHQMKADRFVGHREGTSAYYRNEGEQHAFAMVLRFLETGEVPL